MKLLETFEKPIKADFESFKSLWRSLYKQERGDVVVWNREQYRVEDVRDPGDNKDSRIKPGEKIYTICRFDSPEGINLKVLCHRVSAKPGDWQSNG